LKLFQSEEKVAYKHLIKLRNPEIFLALKIRKLPRVYKEFNAALDV